MTTNKTGRCVIVAPDLARWVTDFNIVSTYLADTGWDVSVRFPDQKRHKVGWGSDESVQDAAGKLHPAISLNSLPLTTRPSLGVWGVIRASMSAAREAMRRDTLFLLFSAFPIILFGPWLRLFHCRAFYMATGLGTMFNHRREGTLKQKLVILLYRFLYSSHRAIVVVHNKEDKQELVERTGVDPERVFVTGGCGVEPSHYDEFDPATVQFPERPTILVPSRILRDKGTLDAAEASSILSGKGIKHQMLFTADVWFGREDSITKEELATAEGHPDVEFVGFQHDMMDMYRRADVVCIPSWYREGLQTAMLEASAAGKPLVVCNNYGVRDFVRPSIDALVAEPRNAESLAGKLEQVLTDQNKANELRRNAHERLLGGFTSEHMLDITTHALSGIDPRVKPSDFAQRSANRVDQKTQSSVATASS